MTTTKKIITVSLDMGLLNQLNTIAAEDDRPLSYIIRQAGRAFLAHRFNKPVSTTLPRPIRKGRKAITK